jgi:hypothetical protein
MTEVDLAFRIGIVFALVVGVLKICFTLLIVLVVDERARDPRVEKLPWPNES